MTDSHKTRGFFLTSAFAAICLICFQNCSPAADSNAVNAGSGNQDTVVPKGNRTIGFDILDTTPASDFAANITRAKAAGATQMILGLGWNQIEASTPSDCAAAGTYTDPGGALATFNTLLPASGMKLSLSILPVSTSINLRPSNLASTAFDDTLLVCRYEKMLAYVFSKIPNVQLTSIQFGNEIEAFPAANQVSFWSQYWGFFVQVSAAAKTLRPGLQTSIVGTLYGINGQSTNALAQGGLEQIYNNADIVSVTYYPLNSDFTVKNPSVVDSDLTSLVNLYPNKAIVFNEIGFPSGAVYDASSEALQRDYVTQVFKTWDKYPTKITSISFLRLNDLSASAALSLAATYGLGANNQFVEYLQTLGLRTYAGADKPGYSQLKTEAGARGW